MLGTLQRGAVTSVEEAFSITVVHIMREVSLNKINK
jgi:hypothetical protein